MSDNVHIIRDLPQTCLSKLLRKKKKNSVIPNTNFLRVYLGSWDQQRLKRKLAPKQLTPYVRTRRSVSKNFLRKLAKQRNKSQISIFSMFTQVQQPNCPITLTPKSSEQSKPELNKHAENGAFQPTLGAHHVPRDIPVTQAAVVTP